MVTDRDSYIDTPAAQSVQSGAVGRVAARRNTVKQLTLFWEAREVVGAGCKGEETLYTTVQERLRWVYLPTLVKYQQQSLEQRYNRR